jgi:hypothetical protein
MKIIIQMVHHLIRNERITFLPNSRQNAEFLLENIIEINQKKKYSKFYPFTENAMDILQIRIWWSLFFGNSK